jgi:hypothetical protein
MNKAMFAYPTNRGEISPHTDQKPRNLEPDTLRYGVRFDSAKPEDNVSEPGGCTTYFTWHGVPVREYDDFTVTNVGNVSPLMPYLIQKGRKVARGRVTTLEATPAAFGKQGNPKLRGNGTN